MSRWKICVTQNKLFEKNAKNVREIHTANELAFPNTRFEMYSTRPLVKFFANPSSAMPFRCRTKSQWCYGTTVLDC